MKRRARAQVRESLYQALGIIASQAAGFFAAGADVRALWAPALVGSLEHMPMTHVRILIRHVMLPLCRHCPPAHRRAPALQAAGYQVICSACLVSPCAPHRGVPAMSAAAAEQCRASQLRQ
jgi:hypothetical protein